MALFINSMSRRAWLQRSSMAAAAVAAPVWAQPAKPAAAARSLVIAQLVDFSDSQQDVPKDFLIGSRATWQDINARGGIRTRQVTHATVETDGTQPAPMVNASVPVVRQYRETLVRLFDEPPAPHSLACFIAARCTFEVLNNIDGPLTRQSALAGFRSRASLSIGSFRVSFDATRRCGGYVTQSMMAQDGRLIG